MVHGPLDPFRAHFLQWSIIWILSSGNDRRKVPLAAAKSSRCILILGSSVPHMHAAPLGGCGANGNLQNGPVERGCVAARVDFAILQKVLEKIYS
jgi:hypothetical protein